MKSLGQIGYEAYAKSTGGKTWDGRAMPTWGEVCDLSPKVMQAWEDAARALTIEVGEGARAECEKYAADMQVAKPLTDEQVDEWRKNLDGKTLDNGRTAAAYDCAHAIRDRFNLPGDVPQRHHHDKRGLTFSSALEYLKRGHRVAREGWNGKGMWVALTPGSIIAAPQARAGAAQHLADSLPMVSGEPDGAIRILPHVDMRTAQGDLQPGWLVSQTDMLAEDWMVLP